MKKIVLLLLFSILFSCERKEPDFSKEMIENLADRGQIKNGIVKLPPLSSFNDLYVLTNNNEIHRSSQNELSYYYNNFYSKEFKTFEDFLNAVLNDKFVLDKKKFPNPEYLKSFKINPKIEKQYASLGLDKFLEKYSKPSVRKGDVEFNTSNMESNEFLTISYFLYINRFDLIVDDVQAKYYIQKRDDSFK